jgi:arginase
MRNVELIVVPWDSGRREYRMGKGPLVLRDALGAMLGRGGKSPAVTQCDNHSPFTTEAAAAFELASEISAGASAADARGNLPLVLSGNCASSLGTVSALGGDRTAVIWFDAHGDFNTPETSPSGFFDGMALATLAGRCWTDATTSIPGWAVVPEHHVVLAGARDLDDDERLALENSGIARAKVDPHDEHALVHAIRAALDAMHPSITGAYVHVDLDVFDTSVGRANQFAAPHGVTLATMLHAIGTIRYHVDVRGAAITAYDPEFDVDGTMARAATEVARALVT